MEQYDYSDDVPQASAVRRAERNWDAGKMNQMLLEKQAQDNQINQLKAAQSQQMIDPQSLQQYKLGQLGGYNQQAAAGDLAQATLPGQIGAQNSENQVKIGKAQKDALLQGVDKIILNFGETPDLGSAMKAVDAIQDPQFKQVVGQMVQQYGPQKAAEFAKKFRDRLISIDADTAPHRNKMEEINTNRASAEKIAAGNNATTLDAARIHASALANRAPTAETTDKAVARLTAIITNPSTPPEVKQQAEAQLRTIITTKQQTNPAMNAPKPDMNAYGVETTTPAQVANQPSAFGGGTPAPQDPLGIRR